MRIQSLQRGNGPAIFTLMELELVEPTLFFDQHPLAVQQFVYFFNSSLTAASIC